MRLIPLLLFFLTAPTTLAGFTFDQTEWLALNKWILLRFEQCGAGASQTLLSSQDIASLEAQGWQLEHQSTFSPYDGVVAKKKLYSHPKDAGAWVETNTLIYGGQLPRHTHPGVKYECLK